MCARYQRELTHTQLEGLLRLVESHIFDARADVRPTDPAPVVLFSRLRGGLMSTPMAWGLVPSWAKDRGIARKTFNARSETAREKPAFRSAWHHRRALVPATAWVEWTGEARAKTAWRVRDAEHRPLFLAGLWETWSPPDAEPLRTFTLLTRDAREDLQWLHDRMPVVLDAPYLEPWLHGELDELPLTAASLVTEAL